MKFISYLTKATYLKRTLGFLTEVSLINKRPLIIRSPSLRPVPDCEILGTRIWFSAASGFNYLPTWEIAEIDDGHLVCVNSEHIKPTFNEAIRNDYIKQLEGYRPFTGVCAYETLKNPLIFLQKNSCSCFVGLEHVAHADKYGVAFIEENTNYGYELITKLIQAKDEGHRAVLCFCVFNTSAKCLKLSPNTDQKYKDLISQALDKGLEIIAYKATISLSEITMDSSIPALISENLIASG